MTPLEEAQAVLNTLEARRAELTAQHEQAVATGAAAQRDLGRFILDRADVAALGGCRSLIRQSEEEEAGIKIALEFLIGDINEAQRAVCTAKADSLLAEYRSASRKITAANTKAERLCRDFAKALAVVTDEAIDGGLEAVFARQALEALHYSIPLADVAPPALAAPSWGLLRGRVKRGAELLAIMDEEVSRNEP